MTPTEAWRPVVGFEGYYEVSSLGRIRGPRGIRRPSTNGRYPTVSLKVGGKATTKRIHILVAAAFLGPRPELGVRVDVCHNNNDPFDNRVQNLRYDTHRNNQRQMVADGHSPNRAKTHCKRGHEFTEDNTWRHAARGTKQRVCRACHYARRSAA